MSREEYRFLHCLFTHRDRPGSGRLTAGYMVGVDECRVCEFGHAEQVALEVEGTVVPDVADSRGQTSGPSL